MPGETAILPLVKIGPYEVLGEIGRGGMGIVYRVRAPDRREAALKTLLKVDPAAFARFERERRLLASLGEEHGFVGLLDAGHSADAAWLVMPFVPGGTLRKRLESGPLGVQETIALGVELARALGAAHERGIVHRDVKPENVLFTAKGRALLADLGLARHFDRSATGGSQSLSLTAAGGIRGTAGYMAPEQLEDARRAGPPADVFSLGAVLYDCLAGRPAFQGDSVLELIQKLERGVVEPIGRPDVPRWLEELVMRMLARDPRARFPDGGSVARALVAGERSRRALAPLVVGAAVLAVAGLVAVVAHERRSRASFARRLAEGAHEKYRARDTNGALADAGKALELDPGLALAWAARGAARGAAGDHDGELADETKALDLEPGLAVGWAYRGVARGNRGDVEGAIADETRAIELDPGLALAWAIRGEAHAHKEELDRAIADLTKAIELDPARAMAWSFRGAARSDRGDFAGAIADETKAIELDPALAIAWVHRGSARASTRDLDGAIADTTRAIELAPRVGAAWAARGAARSNKGDLDGAIADATRAIELAPRVGSAWAARGAARLMQGDYAEAIADETRAIEINSSVATPWSYRSAARLNAGDLDGTIADATRAIDLDRGIATAWLSRGAARSNKGDLDGALDDLSKAIDLQPAAPLAWLNRGITRDKKGDVAGAIADFERALALDPEGPYSARARAALDEAKRAR